MSHSILVADHNPQAAAKLKEILGRAGYAVNTVSAPRGEAAFVNLVRMLDPDLIILDPELAAIVGESILDELANLIPAPAVMLTGWCASGVHSGFCVVEAAITDNSLAEAELLTAVRDCLEAHAVR